MPFIRLSDNYNDHPKFRCLSDGAFRLWHEGMGYCRTFQTDGVIPIGVARSLRAYSPKRARELSTPVTDGWAPLWETLGDACYKVHDYLEWNMSREEENQERASSSARMRRFRERRNDEVGGSYAVTNGVTGGVTNAFVTRDEIAVTNAFVPDRIGTDRKEEVSTVVRKNDNLDGFDLFWSAYPRRDAKKDAQRAWIKLAPGHELRMTIAQAIHRQQSSEAWTKDGGRFIPLPATWLNGRRWEDEGATVSPTAHMTKQTRNIMAAVEAFTGGKHG